MRQPSFADPPFACPPEQPIEIVLDLPFPPSTNHLYERRGNRSFPAAAYEKWKKSADNWTLYKRQYPKQTIRGHFALELLLDRRRRRRRDADNYLKATLDWLQSRKIIRNDKDCDDVRARWAPEDQTPLGCRVTLKELL